jgi:hypothetical protein
MAPSTAGIASFVSGVAADSARDRSPSTGPAEASKLAIPKRERNLRLVDFPNCELACGVSFDWLCSGIEISLRVQSRITIIIAFVIALGLAQQLSRIRKI